jgi:hypothetical protein
MKSSTEMQEDQGVKVRPLTRPDPRRPGEPYKRLDRVEAQILEALALEPSALIALASQLDFNAPDYLLPECLVYLLREHHRAGRHELVNALTGTLIKRCAKHINSKGQGLLEPAYVRECFDEIVGTIFMPLLDLSTDAGDFAQVRFWVYLDYKTLKVLERYLQKQKEDRKTESLDAETDEGDDAPVAVDALRVEGESIFDRAAINKMLDALEEPYRTVYIMRYYGEWEIENKDPEVPTISRHYGRSPRTIRRWLDKAEEQLRLRRGD